MGNFTTRPNAETGGNGREDLWRVRVFASAELAAAGDRPEDEFYLTGLRFMEDLGPNGSSSVAEFIAHPTSDEREHAERRLRQAESILDAMIRATVLVPEDEHGLVIRALVRGRLVRIRTDSAALVATGRLISSSPVPGDESWTFIKLADNRPKEHTA